MFSTDNSLFSAHEAAEYLHVKPSTLAKWRKKRCGPPYSKVGNRCLYRQAALERFVRRLQVCPNNPQQTNKTEA